MSEDEQRLLFARREELRRSAVLESARDIAATFDVMQRESRCAAMKLALAWRVLPGEPGPVNTFGK
jgi:hypothetical protein